MDSIAVGYDNIPEYPIEELDLGRRSSRLDGKVIPFCVLCAIVSFPRRDARHISRVKVCAKNDISK